MTWEHQGNEGAHFEWFRCEECGNRTSLSNRSERYQTHREPTPCVVCARERRAST